VKSKSTLLQAALFATGFSGIVSEYVLATLASYFLGDSITQWALVISLMLFFMGVGARITRSIDKHVFNWLISIEFTLSILVALSAIFTYTLSAFSEYTGFVIYLLSATTGCLIGMELPLAIRLNDQYEILSVNVSNILEKDYYGSLLGGLFFVFLGLPHLGLHYTPILLGIINLLIGIALLNVFQDDKAKRLKWNILGICILSGMIGVAAVSDRIIEFSEQRNYTDKVVFERQTKYQKIVITQWKDDFWLYLNKNLQFSTFDEPLYHESLVHPALALHPKPSKVAILGGGDGCAVREVLKHSTVQEITLVDLDPVMLELAKENDVIVHTNDSSFYSSKLNAITGDAFHWLDTTKAFFDFIIIDLPDPRNVELSRLYSVEFYTLCKRHLRLGGAIVTQAGSPYFTPQSFQCIQKTMEEANFTPIPMHKNIITMGEWGWVIGYSDTTIATQQLIQKMASYPYDSLPLQWMNQSAIQNLTSFGKPYFKQNEEEIKANYIHHPVLYEYYLNGTWDLY